MLTECSDIMTSLRNLTTLKIKYCNLTKLPDFSTFSTKTPIKLDFSGNPIRVLKSDSFRSTLNQTTVIGELNLNGNPRLNFLHDLAFQNVKGLIKLDLSSTSIVKLPTSGLGHLEYLNLENVSTLKKFPPVGKFPKLKVTKLTYSYHCCAFKKPKLQYPLWDWSKFDREFNNKCVEANLKKETSKGGWDVMPLPSTHIINQSTICGSGEIIKFLQNVSCTPAPDAFNPCEGVLGSEWLRVVVWFAILLAVIGNSVVLIVNICTLKTGLRVSKFLISHLSIADLSLGIYLLCLASIDHSTRGVYFNYAIRWQDGPGCQAAGFLAVLAANVSTSALVLLTIERWYTIAYAVRLTKRISLKRAAIAMLLAWIYSVSIATLPLSGVSTYGKTSVCLPMDVSNSQAQIYVFILLLLQIIGFIIIATAYIDIFRRARGGQASGSPVDAKVAKRMAPLVLTDLVCVVPVAFLGLTAAAGYPLVDVSQSKVVVVTFFPLNACANPLIYALLTSQFKKDLLATLAKCGICKDRYQRVRATAHGHIPTSGNSVGSRRNSNNIPATCLLSSRRSSQIRINRLSENMRRKSTDINEFRGIPCDSRKGSSSTYSGCL
ncbi:DgyrCDS11383 [Dimorphilus gyrociliatus]|uniref:DgyrCDS11383 n=1 Tax=Dimorphilus gyrociliatus TaxID=2664684 RepID=A0A7I8W3A8_9ANNE|nr:DgyrCDS11383 [Dimorphilus gyrociliatus]